MLRESSIVVNCNKKNSFTGMKPKSKIRYYVFEIAEKVFSRFSYMGIAYDTCVSINFESPFS